MDLSTLLMAAGWLSVLVFILSFKLTKGRCKSTRNMTGKVVIVTGCTSGIGKETARDLARRGARVIMACRNVVAAKAVKEEIINETGNHQVVVRHLDLSSLKSVREFCKDITQTEKQLDVLVHNAGMAQALKKSLSVDGYEMTIATNQYGPFLMTHLLIDLLKKSKPSRVVVVASSHYRIAIHSLEDGCNHPNAIPWFLYYLSKHANIMFSMELARRLYGTGVTVNCLHPGIIYSEIWRSGAFPFTLILNLLDILIFKNCEEGAQTTLYAAVDEELDGVTGKYFIDCKEAGLTRAVQDPVLCRKLWEDCEKKVKLGPDDPRI